MEELTALIYNFNTDCHKQYTNVSELLGEKLDNILKDIEKFYYSEFWENRFKRRANWDPIQLDIIQGITTELRENTKFKIFNKNQASNGVSNKDTMIALNTNMNKEKLNDSHIINVVMHEFGHRQYNQKEFALIVSLNKEVIGFPGLFIKNNEILNRADYNYFTDHNELRLRVIPIIKEMWDNNWTTALAYDLSENLRLDDIRNIFTKNYILHLINNLL